MNSSMESVCSTQSDTALLLNNSHAPAPHHHMHPGFPRHSQPMHIQAVRCLQEEHRLRPASLPAIPNPFPELCSPAGSPVLSPIQTPNNHTSVAELGIRMGTSAGRISLNLLNPSAVSGKTGAHFRFTRFNLGS
ncbi:hypothetical protein JOQ06_016215 [Pogonophryne albipinna]|uniref:Uncharacterized protein n=1 Tax=Pogonophryne albipinna TaxID=1090488 RepID=A0AAD6FCB4_9TELE|nr:hypothetical protein JOQ06_016215 [Pogonophryne albipinna]